MVDKLSPVIELVYVPVPVPSKLLGFAIVGLGEVLQQTPLIVTGKPPADTTLPPLIAVLEVMDVAVAVAPMEGIVFGVVGVGVVSDLLQALTTMVATKNKANNFGFIKSLLGQFQF